MSQFSERLKELGVVGAGGAGFPTYVKASSRVEIVIANGAECEPLVHKDQELMKNYPGEIVSGLLLMMEATGAGRGKFGIKEGNTGAVEAIRSRLGTSAVDMVLLGDFYPSGDEYELVHIATGRLIPPAGIPLQVGCVVNNVETLYNLYQASRGAPVTAKLVSVMGEVNEPKVLWAPIGTRFADVLAAAGGTKIADFGIMVSGVMMGTLSFDTDDVVTKTTAGLIVLPRSHPLLTRRSQPQADMNRIGKSACDQCSYCTELCPRYLLGYEIMPHKVMRSLGFTATGASFWNKWAQLCCSCGLCTLYACPEDLFPKEACDQAKRDLASEGVRFAQASEVRVHPMKADRRVPLALLRKRLKIEDYEGDCRFEDLRLRPRSVRIPLLQHVGQPAKPTVRQADRVEAGDLIAAVAPTELGANVHASISGKVRVVTDASVEIEV